MAQVTGPLGGASPVVDRTVEHARVVARDRPEEIEAFVRSYYAHVDVDDLEARRIEDLFGMAADHEQLGLGWTPETVALRLYSPKVETHGWESDHSILMIVTDDIPFLVDSVTMELGRLQIGIHLVVHPVLRDRRGDGGWFSGLHEHPEETAGAVSFIAVEIDRRTDPQELAEIEANICRVLGDVRAAVSDWRPMRTRMEEIAASFETTTLPVPIEEIEESRELLEWLAADHYTFLGCRDYELVHEDGVEVLRPVPGTGLGIMRDEGRPGESRVVAGMPPEVRDRVHDTRLLNLTKTGSKATVHRAAYMDYVGIKQFGPDGRVTGERRFIGLFSAEVYVISATRVPRIRRLVAAIIERAGYPLGGHDHKRLLAILENFPRDDLFQIEADELYEIAIGIAGLQERRRVRLFVRPEFFGRYVTCMVYMPRDRYNTETRTGIQELLLGAYGATSADWSTQISSSVLSRTVYVVHVEDGVVAHPDVAELERKISEITADWHDQFRDELVEEHGEDLGLRFAHVYRDAFPVEYQRAFDARAGAADVLHLEALESGAIRLNVYREPGRPTTSFKLKIYRQGGRVSLTSVMPTLNNLGVTVVDERPYEVTGSAEREPAWIYDFSLEHRAGPPDFGELATLTEEAFLAVWNKEVHDDPLNRLVLGAGMNARDISVLRAYSRYLRQTGITTSRTFVARTLDEHPRVARMLTDLFWARFDPDHEDRETSIAAISHALHEAIEAIESLEQDRVLRRFVNLISSTLRTNFFQVDDAGDLRPCLSFKLDPQSVEDLPEPRPRFEIFVYSPRFEGVHLRAGAVARGGLRWSDRREDYRTEVLGLVKAQMVKNAVIVPSGAKGGFVLNRNRSGRDLASRQKEVVICYQLFVSALLDLTDDVRENQIVPPARTVRYDGDDPYLVVAADKGTATFSDIANELSTSRGFWLGDAFASGGSNGYDHKGMGITARGAWESVKRHFRELGRDIQSEDVTVVGIGDMSGDVFGNGLLQSRHARLVAAFDHRHVFVDPRPDPETSYRERRRLFDLPGSSWVDYDPELISPGGGVYERSAKSIDLSEEARQVLGIGAETLTPAELISGLLCAPVDLLWNGGIGTYVKASHETHAEVGDKANDSIRVDGRDLRCLVVGEGGNLGVTQAGRVEFARRDGRIYTDAIDNSAGVDCSDHEVNIKILLDRVVLAGDMTEKQRNELLHQMTDEVASLVLANNYSQTLALSIARLEASSMVDVHSRYLDSLERRDLIDRELEGLPDAEGFADLRLADRGLSTPELAVMLAYAKNTLNSDLLQSEVPDDPAYEQVLIDYFPTPLRDRFRDGILTHPLRREIVATIIANRVVDRGGTSMVYRLTQETSAPAPEVATAHMAAWEIFELEDLRRAVNALDNRLPVARQLAIHLAGRQLAERATRLLVRNRPHPFSAADAIADLADAVRRTTSAIPEFLVGSDRASFDARVKDLVEAGTPDELARRAAALAPSVAALDIVDVATETGRSVEQVAAVHFAIADRLELTWLRDRILDLPRESHWSTLSRLTLRGDLYADHRMLTALVTGMGDGRFDPTDWVERWIQQNLNEVTRFRHTIAEIRTGPTDLTTLLVASREVRNLISRTAG
jgi:glutamate dehydrogenase